MAHRVLQVPHLLLSWMQRTVPMAMHQRCASAMQAAPEPDLNPQWAYNTHGSMVIIALLCRAVAGRSFSVCCTPCCSMYLPWPTWSVVFCSRTVGLLCHAPKPDCMHSGVPHKPKHYIPCCTSLPAVQGKAGHVLTGLCLNTNALRFSWKPQLLFSMLARMCCSSSWR